MKTVVYTFVMNKTILLLTCEHSGNKIPQEYTHLFSESAELLKTHRGYDLGAGSLAFHFAENLNSKLFITNISRLVVDTNRSLWRRTIFSEITKKLPKSEKQTILDRYYFPHNKAIEDFAKKETGTGNRIVHIAVHTFTPVLKGEVRTTDIGLLFNPQRTNEKHFCALWKKEIMKNFPENKVRFNYPYRGKPDGVAARLRKKHDNNIYLGIELEVNQKFVNKSAKIPESFCTSLVSSFQQTLNVFEWI